MRDVLIIGIATVDAIARPVDAFPAPGGLRFFNDLTLTTGGCAVNCAIALAKLGGVATGGGCDVVARVGSDVHGDLVIKELRRHGIATDTIVRDPERPTSFSFAAVASGGERSFLHITGANARLCRADVPERLLLGRCIVMVTGVMLMDSLDGEPAAELLRAARAAGATTLMDTVYVESAARDEWVRRVVPALQHLDWFVPSFPEARAITGEIEPGAAARALQEGGARNVAIKLAERGVLLREAGGRETLVPAIPVETVVDATGAGDCWCAGFISGLRDGLPPDAAATRAIAAAAMGIQAPGAATGVGSLAEVETMITESSARRAATPIAGGQASLRARPPDNGPDAHP
jgi:sugar/nucleoside kinase (ribokinase family)